MKESDIPKRQPWYRDQRIPASDDFWPNGVGFIPSTPGYLPDPGRPTIEERLAIARGNAGRGIQVQEHIKNQRNK